MRLAGSLNVYFVEFYKLAEDVSPLHKFCKKYWNPYFSRKSVELLSHRPPLLVLYKVHKIFQPGLISVGLNFNHSLSLEIETHSVLYCVAQIVSKTERGTILRSLQINNHRSGYKWDYSDDEECYLGKYSDDNLCLWCISENPHIKLIPRNPKKVDLESALCFDRNNIFCHLIHRGIIANPKQYIIHCYFIKTWCQGFCI